MWDTFACPPTVGDKFREWMSQGKFGPWFIRSHWPITVLTAGVAVAAYQMLEVPAAAHEPTSDSDSQSFADWSSTARLLLAVPLGVFLLWRIYYWRKTRQQMEADLNDAIDLVAAPVADAGPTEHLDLFVNGGFVEVRGRVPIPAAAPPTGDGGRM